MTEAQSITSVHPIWRPGDVVLDANGDIRVRTAHPKWVWDYPNEGSTRSQFGGPFVPEGALEDSDVPRPLTLLVRDGQAVGGRVLEE